MPIEVKTTQIRAVSRVAFKDKRDNWFTLEFEEIRTVSGDYTEKELNKAKTALWDSVNAEVDTQIEEIVGKK